MPIALPRVEWNRLQRSCAGAADEDAERALYVQRLDEASGEMTKTWPNSLENVNRRNEEVRLARIRTAELANERFYEGYLKRQRDERTRMMERARDRVFKDKDAPKTLLSAVIKCAVLKEREAQIEFDNELKRQQDGMDKEYAEQVKEGARLWLEERRNKIKARFLRNKEFQIEISKQIKELSERTRHEREETIRLEQDDNVKAQQQMAFIKAFEEKYILDERARIKADMEQATKEVAERRREEDEREVLDEKLRQVYLGYKHRVDCRRAFTEREVLKEKLRVLENISKKLQSGTAARDAKENEILNKAVRERDEKLAASREADERKIAGFVRDRKEQRRKFLEDEKQRQHEEYTMRAWALLNRYKSDELNKEFEQKLREKDWRTTLQHREDLLTLAKERRDRDASEHAAWQYFHGELAEQRLHEADQKLLKHAEVLLKESQLEGRPTYPIEKAVQTYKRIYELFPARNLPASQQEHFRGYAPQDRTGIVQAQPASEPPAAAGSAAEPAKANGLQGTQVEKPKLERIKDDINYKRQGKVNGLQEKSPKTECELLKLPPIPCTSIKLYECRSE